MYGNWDQNRRDVFESGRLIFTQCIVTGTYISTNIVAPILVDLMKQKWIFIVIPLSSDFY